MSILGQCGKLCATSQLENHDQTNEHVAVGFEKICSFSAVVCMLTYTTCALLVQFYEFFYHYPLFLP